MVRKIVKAIAEKTAPNLVTHYRAYDRLVRIKESYLNSSGWLKSLHEERPCDSTGSALPWMAFPMIALLRERVTKEHNLFEFGSGFSTEFYATLAKSVVSIEHDQEWLDLIREKLPSNATVQFQPLDANGEYCRAAQKAETPPDVVVIDGRDRVNCLKETVPSCPSQTVYIFDDTHRQKYEVGLDWAVQQGYRLLRLEGLKPGGLELNQSTLIYKPENVFGI